MTALIDIVTPTLWRSERLARYVENIHAATECEHRVTFVAEKHDRDTVTTVKTLAAYDPRVRLIYNDRAKNCLGAFNSAVRHITAPFWFGSGDDVRFYEAWDRPLLKLMGEGFQVVGTDDLSPNPNVRNLTSATHMLIDTNYILVQGGTLDLGPGIACCEDYHHGFFDTELIEVAKERGVWSPCMESKVEHMHAAFGKSHIDATYQHGFAADGSEDRDRSLWAERRKLLKNPEC